MGIVSFWSKLKQYAREILDEDSAFINEQKVKRKLLQLNCPNQASMVKARAVLRNTPIIPKPDDEY